MIWSHREIEDEGFLCCCSARLCLPLYVAITVPLSKMTSQQRSTILRSKGTEAGMLRLVPWVGGPRMSNQGDADSRGIDLLLGPLVLHRLVAQAKAYRRAVTWDVARGAAQTNMQGSTGRSHEEESHEDDHGEWDGGKRNSSHEWDDTWCYAHRDLPRAWRAG